MDPLAEYERRRDRRQTEATTLQRRFLRIGNARLLVAVIAAAAAWLRIWRHVISEWWLLLPLAGFAALFVWHQKVIRKRTLARRSVAYYERGINRINDRWSGVGETGEQLRDGGHVYADDLDVFGKGSLFQMISTARTQAGEARLAEWLLSPANTDIVLGRQAAVRELASKLDLLEDLATLGEDVQSSVGVQQLERWGMLPPIDFPQWLRWVALFCSVAALAALGCLLAGVLPVWPLGAIVLLELLLIVLLRKRTAGILASAEAAAHKLEIVAVLLERLERASFDTALLQRLRRALDTGGLAASKRIARLTQWIDVLHAADSPVLRLLKPLLLWDEQVAMAIEAWRNHSGRAVASWLSAIADFEALTSLATLTFEHPHWRFPEFCAEAACFHAEGLRHPLLADAHCIPNDVFLGDSRRLMIVSGSNMSGKSTLLRAIGLNTVLALAGAPVAAQRLQISALQTAASIRVTDSLQDGRSRFLAEIQRIRQIVEMTGTPPPVLFLLDEVLSGTNSHDRRIGASAIVHGLINSGAIGLITTHDLALAEIESDLDARAMNVHFDDQVRDGVMHFDYQLRPGVVTHSNALELMRSVGLKI